MAPRLAKQQKPGCCCKEADDADDDGDGGGGGDGGDGGGGGGADGGGGGDDDDDDDDEDDDDDDDDDSLVILNVLFTTTSQKQTQMARDLIANSSIHVLDGSITMASKILVRELCIFMHPKTGTAMGDIYAIVVLGRSQTWRCTQSLGLKKAKAKLGN